MPSEKPSWMPSRDAHVPILRIQHCNSAPVQSNGKYVVYWMIGFRRLEWNFSLQRAVEWANELERPLVIFEPLRIGYRWACDRFHRFVLDGMADHQRQTSEHRSVFYYPYVEPKPDADKGLLQAIAQDACVIVTDDCPYFFLPRMVAAAAARLDVRLEKVDSNGLLPLRATERVFTTAFSFRAYLQKELRPHLEQFPQPRPLKQLKTPPIKSLGTITDRWPTASPKLLAGDASELNALAIDHSVAIVDYGGGSRAARKQLRAFLDQHLSDYVALGNHPDVNARSGLSPYLHFGHISSHEMFHELMTREVWELDRLAGSARGKREGWWKASLGAEAWLDEFVTWREIGFNMASHCENYEQYESLPEWARATLKKHARDRREAVYSLDEFAAAQTHDPLWNAAQTQLVVEGRIHNYLRMLWGKKILEWTASPEEAAEVMIELNNRYAIDGRDPNSYSGIYWCLGRYDRPWGPERPIFGSVRYMSSDSTRKKLRVKEYLSRWGNSQSPTRK